VGLQKIGWVIQPESAKDGDISPPGHFGRDLSPDKMFKRQAIALTMLLNNFIPLEFL
jgi:hypothetical protein